MANTAEQQNTDYDYLIKFLALGDSGKFDSISRLLCFKFTVNGTYVNIRLVCLLYYLLCLK